MHCQGQMGTSGVPRVRVVNRRCDSFSYGAQYNMLLLCGCCAVLSWWAVSLTACGVHALSGRRNDCARVPSCIALFSKLTTMLMMMKLTMPMLSKSSAIGSCQTSAHSVEVTKTIDVVPYIVRKDKAYHWFGRCLCAGPRTLAPSCLAGDWDFHVRLGKRPRLPSP